jgi:hypothetical protein
LRRVFFPNASNTLPVNLVSNHISCDDEKLGRKNSFVVARTNVASAQCCGYHFDHFADANPDPDPNADSDADPDFYLMRMPI